MLERGEEVGGGLVVRGGAVDGVAAVGNNLGVVARAGAVPCEELVDCVSRKVKRMEVVGGRTYVGGAGADVGEGSLCGDEEELGLELLGCNVRDGVGRVLCRLEREHVGEQAGNVGRGHGGAGDGVHGRLAADPGRLDVEARGEDVVALAKVAEVGALIGQGGGADGDCVLGGRGRVVARVCVVVARSDGEVDADGDGGVDGAVESGRLATAKGHVGGAALEALALAVLCRLELFQVRLGGPLDTLDDIGHGAGAVAAEDLDGLDACLLGDAVLLAGDGAGAVCAVSIAVLIGVALGYGLAPTGAALKVNVLDVGARVDDVDVDTLATVAVIEVLVEGAKVEALAV